MSEIEQMVVGIEVQEAVDKVVEYILKHKSEFHTPGTALAYWSGLFDNEKIDILAKALKL